MDLKLVGLKVLVTGSSSGIGAGIARGFAAEGADVVVHGRNAERTQAVAHSLRGSKGRVAIAIGDLASDEGAQKVGDQVEQAVGGIDVLINNAGGKASIGNPPWLTISALEWIATYQMNVGAAVRMIQRFLPGMKQRRFGRIIQIASASATQTEPDLGDYQSAKAAMVNLSTSLAKSVALAGVTVNTVSPGSVRTPALDTWLQSLMQQRGWTGNAADFERAHVLEMQPYSVGRLGTVEEIADATLFLASPRSGFITGANLRVDGGQCRSVN